MPETIKIAAIGDINEDILMVRLSYDRDSDKADNKVKQSCLKISREGGALLLEDTIKYVLNNQKGKDEVSGQTQSQVIGYKSHVKSIFSFASFPMLLIFVLTVMLTVGTALNPVVAQTLNAEALDEISEFAEKFCGDYQREGSFERYAASGTAKAEIDGLLKRLVAIGVKGAAEFDSSSYVGVLRRELGGELKSVRECRLKIWNDLKSAVVEPGAALEPKVEETRRLVSEAAKKAETAQRRARESRFHAREAKKKGTYAAEQGRHYAELARQAEKDGTASKRRLSYVEGTKGPGSWSAGQFFLGMKKKEFGVSVRPKYGRFEGEFRYTVLNGYGMAAYPSDDRYEGEFRESRPNGYGVYTWLDGSYYEGEWRDGQQHGYGIFASARGYLYEGEYRENIKDGHGVVTFESGNRYEGEFRYDDLDGYGTKFYIDGRREEGIWKGGFLINTDNR